MRGNKREWGMVATGFALGRLGWWAGSVKAGETASSPSVQMEKGEAFKTTSF